MSGYIDISLQIIFYSSQAAYSSYLPNGVTEQTRRHASGMTSSLPKPPFRRKNLADISYTDRVIANFVPNVVAMATGVDKRKCDWQHSMAHPRKSPYRRNNLADIFYTNPLIISFVSNFVAMATMVGEEKCNWQHSIAHPRKTLYRRENLPKISYASQVIANFVLNSLPWQRGSVGEKCNWQHSMAHPRKPPKGAKISQKSFMQAEL